ncbi:MAG: hypothetical protein HZC42_14535 [Candidatus Eisenbacteria bacterium]|nr:hypothetical protein [Candidatus Eisenbacteria bacterium]
MKRTKALLLLVAATCLTAAPARATKYAGEFLKIPIGARAIGMGGAFTAVSDDATAPYWNPAGMVYLPYREVIPQHQEKFGSLANHDYVGAVFPLDGVKGRHSALGVGVIRFAVDDIPITPRPGQLRPNVDFLDYGPDNDPTTPDPGQANGVWDRGERLLISADDLYMASSSDLAVLLSFARQKSEHWAFGGNLKFVRQSIPDTLPGDHVTSFGAGLDAGALWMPTDAITFGATLHDLTTTYLAWSNGTHELIVPTLDTGVAFNFKPAEAHALTWAIDLAWGFERRTLDSQIALGGQTWDVRTGLEWWYRNMLALRTGVGGKDLAFGAGLRYKQIGVDYAAQLHRFFAADDQQFPGDQNLDTTHLVSASFSW